MSVQYRSKNATTPSTGNATPSIGLLTLPGLFLIPMSSGASFM